MKEGIKITREEANEIIADQMYKPREQVTVCWQGQWYDIRGMNKDERWAFISSLIGEPVTEKDSINIDIDLSKYEQCIDLQSHKDRGEDHCNGSCQLNVKGEEDFWKE